MISEFFSEKMDRCFLYSTKCINCSVNELISLFVLYWTLPIQQLDILPLRDGQWALSLRLFT
jgi:hypothetical protein